MADRLWNLAGTAFVAAAVSGALLVGTPTASASPEAGAGSDSGTTQSAPENTSAGSEHPERAGNRSKRGRPAERVRGDNRAAVSGQISKIAPAEAVPGPDTAPAVAPSAPEPNGAPTVDARKHRVPTVGEFPARAPRRIASVGRPNLGTVTAPTGIATTTANAARTSVAAASPAATPGQPAEAVVRIPSSTRVTETVTRAPSLLNIIGSVVVNVLQGLIHLIDGPPMLPPGSTVTVGRSSLVLPIGAGRSVEANWYFPEGADASTRLIYLQHGFMASAPMYSYTAARLAERTGAIVLAPSLSSNFFDPGAVWLGGSTLQRAVADLFVGTRSALNESASAAAGHPVVMPSKVVLVGHSAGGTLVTAAAGYMADNGAIDDLAGVVLLDGVEVSHSHAVADALTKLRGGNDRPIYLMSSLRYFWNRNGDMADKLALARPDRFTGVGLTGGLHIDYLQGGNALMQIAEYIAAGFSDPRNIGAAGLIAAGWVDDLFAGNTASGIYGQPGQQIPIATPAGTATAVVFPLGQPESNLLSALVNGFFNAILDYVGVFAVFDPLTSPTP